MFNSKFNHQYKNISSNIEYQIPNSYRTNISFPYGDITSPEQKIALLFQNVLEENASQILNYLILSDLSLLRGANQKIKIIIDKYYSLRLTIQYNDIKNFENKNKLKKEEFLKIYDLQIPISTNNWFYFNLEKAIDTILSLNRKTIAQLRSIKKLTNLDENIYAPFCIIFNFSSDHEEIINNGWKKVADNILFDSKFFINIANLKYENFEDDDILEAFSYLNEIENNIDKIKRYSYALYELNIWCKSVVIYHILVHPYKYRNIQNSIQIGSDIYNFIFFMNEIINKFYLFKGYLEIKKIIKTCLGDYVFTFDYQKKNNDQIIIENEQDSNKLINEINNETIISNILSYLPLEDSYLFINVSKFGFNCFIKSLNLSCYYILKDIFILKYNSFNSLYSLIPTIFENNIFSNYFLMLEDIINTTKNSQQSKIDIISFLTKDNINDIKNYKGNNELIDSICKIFCYLFNIKVEKSFNKDYYLVYLYNKSVILLSVKGNLTKLIKYFNIYSLTNNQIKLLYEELSSIYSLDKIKKVKSINKGYYQLLLWEIYIFEYIKQFNPFLFINKKVFLNNDSLNEEQINIINIYIEYLDKLKKILNFKYHFDKLFFKKNKNYSNDFSSIIYNLIKQLKENQNYDNIDVIIDTYNVKQNNISKAYFKCNNIVDNKNKPSLFRKIMEEIILANVEMVKGDGNNDDENNPNNNDLKDENFYFNTFLNNKNINNNNNNYIFTFKDKNPTNFCSPKNNKSKSKSNYKNMNKNGNPNYFSNYKNNEINKYNNIKVYSPQNEYNSSSNKYVNNNRKELNHLNNIYNINITNNTNKSYNFNNYGNFNFINNNNFYDIPENIIINKILFYLSIDDFPKLSLVNKYFYQSIKIHIYIRLFLLEKKKNNIENKYNDIIVNINNKRNKFYKENNISPPSLKHACSLFSQFNKNDIYELKLLFKNYKKEYEIIISVLCIFLNIKPKIYINDESKKIIDFFNPGKMLIYNKDFIKIIQSIDLDSLNYQTFTKVEKIMQNEAFSIEKRKCNYSPSIIHLINFEMGVMEYFRAIRRYCLNFYDYYILDKNEIYFCQKMNDILDKYYKIKNYTYNNCQKYHQKSIELLKTIDLEQNFVGEIPDEIEININNNDNLEDSKAVINNEDTEDNEENEDNKNDEINERNNIDNGNNINNENDNSEDYNNTNNDKNGQ